MKIRICNVGSTSLKHQLFDMDDGEKVLCTGDAVHQEEVFSTHREPSALCWSKFCVVVWNPCWRFPVTVENETLYVKEVKKL